MSRKQTEARQVCYKCGGWMYYGHGVMHVYPDGTERRLHQKCYDKQINLEKRVAAVEEEKPKEIILSDVERDVLALWLQFYDRKDVLLMVGRYMHRTQPSVSAALNRCQAKFCVENREQLRERARAAGYDVVNREHIA